MSKGITRRKKPVNKTLFRKQLEAQSLGLQNRIKIQDAVINKLIAETGANLSNLEERSVLTFRLVHGLISYMQENGLTDNILRGHIDKVLAKWKQDAFAIKKNKLEKDLAICENCHFVDAEDKFIADGACPSCKQFDIFFKSEEKEESCST